MAAVSSPKNKEELFACALEHLKKCQFQDFNQLEEHDKGRTFQCKKDNKDYFVKFSFVNLMYLRKWNPDRGELLVRTAIDPRISKIIERAYITKDGNLTNEVNQDLGVAIDVSPMIEGKSLWDYIDENIVEDKAIVLEIDEVLRLGIPIAEQILSLHEMRIVHRDIKPENILLEGGKPRLIDNEFAKYCNLQEPLTPCGTKRYCAPETNNKSLQKNDDLFKLDSFSFGLLLLDMITGEPLEDETIDSFVKGQIMQLPLDEMMYYDHPIKELIRELLRRNPGERMSMSDALQALKAHQAQRAVLKNRPDEKES